MPASASGPKKTEPLSERERSHLRSSRVGCGGIVALLLILTVLVGVIPVAIMAMEPDGISAAAVGWIAFFVFCALCLIGSIMLSGDDRVDADIDVGIKEVITGTIDQMPTDSSDGGTPYYYLWVAVDESPPRKIRFLIDESMYNSLHRGEAIRIAFAPSSKTIIELSTASYRFSLDDEPARAEKISAERASRPPEPTPAPTPAPAPAPRPALRPLALGDYFHDDDGSLPQIELAFSDGARVAAAFEYLFDTGDARDVGPDDSSLRPIAEDTATSATGPGDARAVVDGRTHSFCRSLEGVVREGVALPELGVRVDTQALVLHYRMGPQWGADEIRALMAVLLDLQSLGAVVSVPWWGDDGQHAFRAAMDRVGVERAAQQARDMDEIRQSGQAQTEPLGEEEIRWLAALKSDGFGTALAIAIIPVVVLAAAWNRVGVVGVSLIAILGSVLTLGSLLVHAGRRLLLQADIDGGIKRLATARVVYVRDFDDAPWRVELLTEDTPERRFVITRTGKPRLKFEFGERVRIAYAPQSKTLIKIVGASGEYALAGEPSR